MDKGERSLGIGYGRGGRIVSRVTNSDTFFEKDVHTCKFTSIPHEDEMIQMIQNVEKTLKF